MMAALFKFNPQLQARVASTVAGAGIVWASKVATASRIGMRALVNTPGVVELLCLSILFWLIAKWRSVVSERRPANA